VRTNRSANHLEAYASAQRAMAMLKAAVLQVIAEAPETGLSNAEVGRKLGIYAGHVGHEGHISRTVLGMLLEEGVVLQDEDSKRWRIRE
jgi:DNA-binding IclR family transcriptional regulator